MHKDTSYYIKQMAAASRTSVHEVILQCLDHYKLTGVRDLTWLQAAQFWEAWSREKMNEKGVSTNIVICTNKSCQNWQRGGCSRTFISLGAAGQCLRAKQGEHDEKSKNDERAADDGAGIS